MREMGRGGYICVRDDRERGREGGRERERGRHTNRNRDECLPGGGGGGGGYLKLSSPLSGALQEQEETAEDAAAD